MRQDTKSDPTEAARDPMDAAIVRLRRQFRIRNILLVIVGIEAAVFAVLRTWSVF